MTVFNSPCLTKGLSKKGKVLYFSQNPESSRSGWIKISTAIELLRKMPQNGGITFTVAPEPKETEEKKKKTEKTIDLSAIVGSLNLTAKQKTKLAKVLVAQSEEGEGEGEED